MTGDFLIFYAANYGEHVYCWVVARPFAWDEVRETRFATPDNDAADTGWRGVVLAQGTRDQLRR